MTMDSERLRSRYLSISRERFVAVWQRIEEVQADFPREDPDERTTDLIPLTREEVEYHLLGFWDEFLEDEDDEEQVAEFQARLDTDNPKELADDILDRIFT